MSVNAELTQNTTFLNNENYNIQYEHHQLLVYLTPATLVFIVLKLLELWHFQWLWNIVHTYDNIVTVSKYFGN